MTTTQTTCLVDEGLEKLHNNAYNQGVDHAFRIAQAIAKKNHSSLVAFLLDLSIELANLKEIQSKPTTQQESEKFSKTNDHE